MNAESSTDMTMSDIVEMFDGLLTQRQIDYVVRRRIICPEGTGQGSGHRVRWSDYDVAVLEMITPAIRMGMTADLLAVLASMYDPDKDSYFVPVEPGATSGWLIRTD